MTAAEAVAFILEGYGDDCPEGGDRYEEALIALSDAGLYDLRDGELSSRWPQPKPDPRMASLTRIMRQAYAPAIQVDLNRTIIFTPDLGNGLPRGRRDET